MPETKEYKYDLIDLDDGKVIGSAYTLEEAKELRASCPITVNTDTVVVTFHGTDRVVTDSTWLFESDIRPYGDSPAYKELQRQRGLMTWQERQRIADQEKKDKMTAHKLAKGDKVIFCIGTSGYRIGRIVSLQWDGSPYSIIEDIGGDLFSSSVIAPWSHALNEKIRSLPEDEQQSFLVGWIKLTKGEIMPEQGTIDGNLIRAAACVNACKGINPEAVPLLLEALKFFTAAHVARINSGDCGFWNPEEDAEVIKARAAISKAEGKQ